jgi:hypothetical protein
MGIEEVFGCLVCVLEAVIVSKAIVPADVIGELEASHVDNLAESNVKLSRVQMLWQRRRTESLLLLSCIQ